MAINEQGRQLDIAREAVKLLRMARANRRGFSAVTP